MLPSKRLNKILLSTASHNSLWLKLGTKKLSCFKFLAKAPRAIIHFKKFIECDQMLADFYGVTDVGLKEKAACMLFQIPSRKAFNEAKPG